jgi:hypothetical protein
VRDQAVRQELGIPLRRAAKITGVSHPTMALYEADPQAVRSPSKRYACALFYDELRRLMAMAPLAHRAEESR